MLTPPLMCRVLAAPWLPKQGAWPRSKLLQPAPLTLPQKYTHEHARLAAGVGKSDNGKAADARAADKAAEQDAQMK